MSTGTRLEGFVLAQGQAEDRKFLRPDHGEGSFYGAFIFKTKEMADLKQLQFGAPYYVMRISVTLWEPQA